ncbi:MAG: hypothetical protein JST22_13205 [Bacteroidetes bacterium]|nr:hypothetical protein [Bacteroidota bacterium]
MNIRLLTASLAVVTCGLAITIISCNGDGANVPNAPTQPTHGGKSEHVLGANCSSTLGADRCGAGTAATTYDQETGVLSVTGSNDLASGLKSTFGAAHDGHLDVKTQAPAGPGQQLAAVAYDGLIEQGRIEVGQDLTNPQRSTLRPTFNAGDGIYKINVLSGGTVVGTQENVPVGSTTYAFFSVTITIRIGWVVITVKFGEQQQKGTHANAVNVDAGACEWILGQNGGPAYDFTLPNGQVVHGDEIRFTEQVDGSGRYPYHSVSRLDLLSNMGSFDVLSEQIGE